MTTTNIQTLGCSPIMKAGPPSFATAFGITSCLYFDDMVDSTLTDLNSTMAPGFNWYLPQFTTFAGNSGYTVPSSSFFTWKGSVLTQSSSTTQSNGFEMANRGYLGTSAPRLVGSMPLIDGSKPFYMETSSRFVLPSTNFIPAIWLQDVSLYTQFIDNTGFTAHGAEIDLYEGKTASIQLTMHDWSTPSTNTQNLVQITTGYNLSNFNTWGVLVVPAAFNSGTGFCRWYLNGANPRSDVTWTPGATYSCSETTQYMTMIDTGVNLSHEVDYVVCWAHP